MKILHCADIHLGSSLTSIKDDNIRYKKKCDIINAFLNIIKYANDNDIKIIILAGDVFDNDMPSITDKEHFYSIIKNNKHIEFFYLRGNHDVKNCYYEYLSNLHMFEQNIWNSYNLDNNVCITGIEINNNINNSIYNDLKLNISNINIVILHGDIYNQSANNYIDVKLLKNKNIDYLALGHIHKRSIVDIDKRCVAVYPGCLVGRGFDEIDAKGFYIIDINQNNIEYNFINLKTIEFIIKKVSITSALDISSVENLVNNELKDIDKNCFVRLVLYGNNNTNINNLNTYLYECFCNYFVYFEIVNNTKISVNFGKYKNQTSIINEFIQLTDNDTSLSDEQKIKIKTIGINLFEIGKIEDED